MHNKIFPPVLIMVCVAAFGLVRQTQAITVSPTVIKATIERNNEQVFKLHLHNDKPTPGRYEVHVSSVKADANGTLVFGHAVESAAWHWVQLPTSTFVVLGNRMREVPFTVRVPRDAVPGSYYVAVVASELPGSGQIAVSGSVAVLVDIQVAGLVNESLVIRSWTKVNTNDPQRDVYQLAMSNKGTVEVPLKASVSATTLLGKQLFTEPVALGNIILAGSDRVVRVDTPHITPGWVPKRVNVRIDIPYGLTHQKVNAAVTYWIVPPLFIIFITGLLAVSAGAYYYVYVPKKTP